MARSILSAIVAVGLLASGDVCSWLCQSDAPLAASDVAVESHCAASSSSDPVGPEPVAPTHDDCSGCSAAVAVSSAQPVSPAAHLGLGLGIAIPHTVHVASSAASTQQRVSIQTEHRPPRNILAITTSLLL